jgi:hypothetical protein
MAFLVDGISRSPTGKTQGRRVGEYWAHAEAVAAAKHVIDTFLYKAFIEHAGKDINAHKLLAMCRRNGEKPVILNTQDAQTFVPNFDPIKYAARRCIELCDRARKQ